LCSCYNKLFNISKISFLGFLVLYFLINAEKSESLNNLINFGHIYPANFIQMKHFWFIFSFLTILGAYGQNQLSVDSLYQPDPHYLEDQIYFGISYMVLKNLPEGMQQNGFSNAVKLGFIRDIPVNERRNFGFGIGLGLSWKAFYQNLRVSVDEQTGAINYYLLTQEKYISNSFHFRQLDIPLEIRLRGSTPEKYKFWRIYGGLTVSYVYGNSANYVTNKINVSYQDIHIIEPWQFNLHLSAGYGTWNFSFSYGLSPLLKRDLQLNGQNFNIKSMDFGIMYYFL